MVGSQYAIEAPIGSGHFGEVYRARHTYLTGRVVALKLIPAGTDADEVLQEARKAAALSDHDNVVKVHDAGIWIDGRVYIASDLCEFGSLEDQVALGPLDPGSACRAISDSCRGLAHMHQAGLLHLDLRPANIMLTEKGVPRLTDFGLARWSHDAQVDDWYTPHAGPEFVETGKATVASDIYAMGMTLAHLLTGGAICRPFPQWAQLVADSMNGVWPRLDELGRNVPAKLRKVIEHATQYDPNDRPQDISTFKRELDRATPRVSLVENGDGSMTSADGRWTIVGRIGRDGKHAVDVKRDTRRRTILCAEELTPSAAIRHVHKVVKLLAEEQLSSKLT